MIDFEKKEIHLGEWSIEELAIAIEAMRQYPDLNDFKFVIDDTRFTNSIEESGQ